MAQNNYPQNYFISPLNIPIVLSGSFGELRSGHFHSGLDIKTQGVTGKKVFAPADGYISRIKISPWGYGKALYVTHANGYTSVYAHLSKYNDTITKLIKQAQYQQERFDVEVFPSKGSIKVKQGDIIAFTGNSGSSGGPHLHFEIRNSAQQPINPLFFGIKVNDNKYPNMQKLRIYNYSKSPKDKVQEFNLYQKKGYVYKKYGDTIIVSTAQFYPAVEGFDRFNGANNKNGYFKLEFYLDSVLYCRFTADRFDFREKRYINSYIDYRTYKYKKQRFQRSLVEENSHLRNITDIVNNGIMTLSDSLAHKVTIKAYDFEGQTSTLEVYVKYKEADISAHNSESSYFEWNHENIYKSSNFEIIIPKGAFYSNQYFTSNISKNKYSTYSKLCHIYDIGVPLHKKYQLKIKAQNVQNVTDKSKLCIVSLNNDEDIIYEAGSFTNGWMKIKTRSFGRYYIEIDSLAPILKANNVYNNKNITKQYQISFKVTDNLSGIKSYKATINGKWVLLEYDPKRNHLFYVIDENLKAGNNIFKIEVSDDRDNKSSKKYTLIRN